ncbi:MAG: tol-pal system protein YbgF [Desulfarculus sp.]|nr:tol-pal system protein YbgF [Desulfarculus sp.]
MTMPRISLALCLLLALAQGCSMVDQQDFNALQSQVAREQQKVRELTRRVDQLSKSVEGSRGPQASVVADMDYVRQELMRINGRLDEVGMQSGQASAPPEVEQRLARLEAYLGMRPGEGPAAPPPPAAVAPAPASAPAPVAAPPKPTPKPAPKASDDDDRPSAASPKSAQGIYDLGLRLYKQKSYDAARDRFEDLVKKFPKDKLVDNAQFWVGESYYAQKKYEEAILAYNQLVKKWPQSDKAPGALLKQGMAFKELGDKRTAKIVLGNLIKSYPKSAEAKSAEKLMEKLN